MNTQPSTKINVIHRLGKKERSGRGDHKFLLTNKKGNYLLLGSQTSDFDGLFVQDKETSSLFKTVQNLRIEGEPDTIINHLGWIERKTKLASEKFYVTSNALIYDIENYTGYATITLDCKRLYDEDTNGRIYSERLNDHASLLSKELKESKETTLSSLAVSYTKYSGLDKNYHRHLFILVEDAHIDVINEWREITLPYDARRGMQATRWVYDVARIPINGSARIIITSSQNETKAFDKAKYVYSHQHSILDACEQYPLRRFQGDNIIRAVASSSLDSLITKLKINTHRGIFAGLPWFFQYWMRDEAISLEALIIEKQYALAKEILMRWTRSIAKAQTFSHDRSTLASADAPGLLAKRITKLLIVLQKEREHFFTNRELLEIFRAFHMYLESLSFAHGLVQNLSKETWMDTDANHSGREGVRLEIQSCTLAIYDLQILLAKILKKEKKPYVLARKELIVNTKQWFFDSRGWLHDGYEISGACDDTIRPNIFLAWYIFPDLLTKQEWSTSFAHNIPKLWLSWGGLSSIDTSDPRYVERHSGIDNKSYHNGDSWYFVNNIAAMALFSTDPHKYHKQITALIDASVSDLLFLGVVGHASELSDAKEQLPGGCFAQAWSAATLIELIELMK